MPVSHEEARAQHDAAMIVDARQRPFALKVIAQYSRGMLTIEELREELQIIELTK